MTRWNLIVTALWLAGILAAFYAMMLSFIDATGGAL